MANEQSMVQTLAQELLRVWDSGQRYWIGLAGAPGSGKSTLAENIKQAFDALLASRGDDGELLVLPMDGYHLPRKALDTLPAPATAHLRRGAPFTFDAEQCVADLLAAKHTEQALFPGFDHAEGDPQLGQYRLTAAHQLVLVEGNYLLLNDSPWRRLKGELFNECWFVNTPLEVSNQRVLERHQSLGLSLEQAQHRVDANDGLNARYIHEHSNFYGVRLIDW